MHGLHLSDFFSKVCFQMCPQIVGSRGDKVKSKWVLKLPIRERMQSHIACITFFRCVFSNVSSNRLFEMTHRCTCCICLTFSMCIFEWVLKLLAWEEAESHWFKLSPNWLHLFDFFDISSFFSSDFLHLHQYSQVIIPLPMCVLLCPNDWLKLDKKTWLTFKLQ